MNVNQVLRRLKIMLSANYKFAEATLIDGAEVYSEGEFVPGAILFVRAGEGVSEDPFAPAGQHETTSGLILTVGENGEITEVEDKNAEIAEEGAEAPLAEEAMEEEVAVEVPEEVAPVMTEEVVQAVIDALAPVVEEVATLTEEVVALKKRFETMAAQPAAKPIKSQFKKVVAENNDAMQSRLEMLAKMRNSK